MKKKVRYFFEYLLVVCLYYPCRLFSFDATSNFFGKLLQVIGPLVKPADHRRIKKNIKLCFPDFSEELVEQIARESWNNIGRFIGEFPHLNSLTGEEFSRRVEVEGAHYVDEAVKGGKGAIIFSGHFANWEMLPKAGYEYGVPMAVIYRPANNPYVNRLLLRARSKSHDGMFAKGKESMRKIVQALNNSQITAMLVDQKANEGLKLKFFGRDAMTTPGPAQLALKFGCPLLPSIVFRDGAKFKVRMLPPLVIEKTGDITVDTSNIMQEINDILESFVKERPGGWLWLHNRWVEN